MFWKYRVLKSLNVIFLLVSSSKNAEIDEKVALGSVGRRLFVKIFEIILLKHDFLGDKTLFNNSVFSNTEVHLSYQRPLKL